MSFIDALATTGPAPDRGENMALYGWLIGDWTMDATVYGDDGSEHVASGSIHFGWVLQGRAIQDVWILPGFFHGTTLRIYDPGLDAWHILWSDPLKQYFTRQIGRAHGKDIVQNGRNDAGEPTRWSFIDITPSAFRWIGERSLDDGATWHRQAVFHARRTVVPTMARPMIPGATAGTVLEKKPMIDHVSIGVRDLSVAKRFYDAALRPLGYTCQSEAASEAADTLGYGAADVAFWVSVADRRVPADEQSGLHFCFVAPSRDSVHAFHAAALQTGGTDNGPPGLRPDYGPDYYAAFIIDPDGYRIEAYHAG
jgi:catechol 2,3-dioxygenase-like lactoylglutathione lyase family enzyme